MIGLAKFVEQGVSQAALVASTSLLLAILAMLQPALMLLMPLALLLSAATPALVWLRHGAQRAVIVVAIASFGLMVFGWWVFQSLGVFLLLALTLWGPVLVLAMTLRQWVNLAWTIVLGTLLSGVLVLLVQLLYPELPAFWQEILEIQFTAIQQAQPDVVVQPEDVTALAQRLSTWMTGAMAAWLLLLSLGALFIARYWQAALYHADGFRQEFHSLRLGRQVLWAFTAVLFLGTVGSSVLLQNLVPVVLIGAVLQGVAIVHGIRYLRGGSRAVLVLLYALLLIGLVMPQVAMMLLILSLIDAHVDFRSRVGTIQNS